jgi:hypothetical protein
MNRIALTVVVASSLALTLGGCASISDFTIDPTEWFSGDWFGNKKKLPGDRRAVFPEGVPGVTRGIPSELMKGHQEPADLDAPAQATQAAAATEEKPKQKAKAKPKPKVAAKPASADDEPRPTQVTVRRAPAAGAQQQPAASSWPDPPAPQGQRSASPQWPDPPAPRGTQSGGGAQWPDPPPAR